MNSNETEQFDKVVEDLCKMDNSDHIEGKDEYMECLNHFKLRVGELVYYKGIKSFAITQDKHNYFLGENSYDKKAISTLLKSSEKYDKLLRYMLKNYNMRNKPQIHKYCYLANATSNDTRGFKLRKDLEPSKNEFDKWVSMASTLNVEFDLNTSSYNCYIPVIKRVKKDNKTINKYLDITFGKHKDMIMDYISIYTFENRYGISRPTLLFTGDRGTGKNTFLETFLSQIYKGVSDEVTIGDGFSEWQDGKLAYIDEATDKKHDISFLWDLSKQISGQGYSKINRKSQGKYRIDNGLYLVMMSNEAKPLHIKDKILSEAENQLLCIKLKTEQSILKDIKEMKLSIMKKGYYDFKDFFNDHLGHWVFTDLFKHYEKLKQRIKNKPYRYGMPVPITEGLKEIIGLSISGNDANLFGIIESLYYQDYQAYTYLSEDEQMLFKSFAGGTDDGVKGFIPYTLLIKLLKSHDMLSSFTKFIAKNDWIIEMKIRIKPFASDTMLGYDKRNKSYDGVLLNIKAIEDYIVSKEAESDVLLDELTESIAENDTITSMALEDFKEKEPEEEIIEEIEFKEAELLESEIDELL